MTGRPKKPRPVVVPVPFLGTTWVNRGAGYWWRRAGAALTLLLGSALVGVFVTGFTIGIIGGGGNPVRVVLGVLYDLTAVLGVRTGLRIVAEAPHDSRLGLAGTHAPSGCLVFVIAPYTFAVVFTVFAAMLGPNFPGETRARALSRPT